MNNIRNWNANTVRIAFNESYTGREPKKAGPIQPDHGENRAELDEHLEDAGEVALEVDPIARDDQMAGGRDGNELGNALDDSEDRRLGEWMELAGGAQAHASTSS